jgi:hypothetical protein
VRRSLRIAPSCSEDGVAKLAVGDSGRILFHVKSIFGGLEGANTGPSLATQADFAIRVCEKDLTGRHAWEQLVQCGGTGVTNEGSDLDLMHGQYQSAGSAMAGDSCHHR